MKRLMKIVFHAIRLFLIISTCFTITNPVSAQEPPKFIHAFVALCDNAHQGIVPVPEKLGNGNDPKNNLYWGAMYGVKTFFKKSPNWNLTKTVPVSPPILERCIFKHQRKNVFFIADAYQGKEIRQTVIDFLDAASGKVKDNIMISIDAQLVDIAINGNSGLIVYVGHNGLMDFKLKEYPIKQDHKVRETIILACASKAYFRDAVLAAGAKPLLWTTGLMAPEAYTLENAIEGWVSGENDAGIRLRAAKSYSKYQKCGLEAAKRLLVSGM